MRTDLPWRGSIAAAALAAACGSNGAQPDGGPGGRTDAGGGWGLDLGTGQPDASACTPLSAPLPDAGTGGTRRYYPPTRFMLGPIYGTGCPDWGECESGGTMTDEVNRHLDRLADADIPITMYHFDGGGWSDSQTCDWTLGDALAARLTASGLRALLHFWGGCDSVVAFDHVYGQLGHTLAGFYLDETSTDALAKAATDWVQSKMPGDSEIVMKAYQDDSDETDAGLAMYGHSCYVNDLFSDFTYLKEGIRRVFSKANVLPAPFNEFTGYDTNWDRPDEETFFRRIHFGAMQVVMDHSPQQNTSPWNPPYDQKLLDDYRTFAWLHKELVPYLHSYDWNAYETGAPIFRDADAEAFTTRIGDEIFVAYITDPVATRPEIDIKLPPGEWIDYWDTRDVVSGMLHRAVPLGKEPIFFANGAIVPMDVSRDYTGHGKAASAGSLTVLVYPKGDSSFRYRDDQANRWIAFQAHQATGRLQLAASAGLSQPVLYRVERMTEAPSSVSICGASVTVGDGAGAGIPAAANEDAVDGASAPAWFYDADHDRLIVKAFP